MWGMQNSEGQARIFHLVTFMLLILVGCQILPTTLRIFTHMDHVHIASILIIGLETVHPMGNLPNFFFFFDMSTQG